MDEDIIREWIDFELLHLAAGVKNRFKIPFKDIIRLIKEVVN